MTRTWEDFDNYLKYAGPHIMGGDVRQYKFTEKIGVSLVNSPHLHSLTYAWEAAIFDTQGLRYDTPLTSDVEVFNTDEETLEFLERVMNYALYGEEEPPRHTHHEQRRERPAITRPITQDDLALFHHQVKGLDYEDYFREKIG